MKPPTATVAVDRRLQLTITDMSMPPRQLGVQLTRAAALRLADLLDAAAQPEAIGADGGTVIAEPASARGRGGASE